MARCRRWIAVVKSKYTTNATILTSWQHAWMHNQGRGLFTPPAKFSLIFWCPKGITAIVLLNVSSHWDRYHVFKWPCVWAQRSRYLISLCIVYSAVAALSLVVLLLPPPAAQTYGAYNRCSMVANPLPPPIYSLHTYFQLMHIGCFLVRRLRACLHLALPAVPRPHRSLLCFNNATRVLLINEETRQAGSVEGLAFLLSIVFLIYHCNLYISTKLEDKQVCV